MSLPRPTALCSRPAGLPVLAAAVLLGAGCPRSAPARELPEPPSIVAAPPSSPVPADPGMPGSWQTLATTPASRAFVVDAEGGAPGGALLLVHAEWGVDAEMRSLARKFAARGLTVVVPDVYEGVESTSRVSSQVLIAGVARDRCAAVLAAGLEHLRARPGVAGRKVALLGVGVGGNWGFSLVERGAALDGMVFDTSPLDREQLPGPSQASVMMLTGSENLSLSGSRHDRIVDAFRGRPFEWRTVPGAGTTLLDARALGFSVAALDLAVDEVVAFVRAL